MKVAGIIRKLAKRLKVAREVMERISVNYVGKEF